MSEELNQEQEIQSDEVVENTEETTDTPLEGSDSPSDESSDNSDTNTQDDEKLLSTEQIESLTDDEFEEYLSSDKIPERFTKTQVKETPTETKAKVISKPDKQPETTQEQVKQEIDYKAAYESLFKPFKANGKEITPRTMEDIVSLMQMGANYTKKMQLMAPMKKAVESLNKASINEDDLNFLIDLHKGDKEAIKSLLKKHSIDPIDLDLEDVQYVANKKNIASESDVKFSDMLLDVQESLPKINDILNNQWDSKSKSELLNDPKLIRALHEEIQLGRFDKVQEEVERAKTLGKYKDVSDLAAYIDIVTNMVNNGQFNNQGNANKPTVQVKTNSKPIPDKSKAAPTKGKSKTQPSLTAKDLFSMSEEEFSKLSINDLV